MTTNVTILKIEDPFHFWGKEVLGPGMSQETIQFQELCEEIEDYCSSDQYVIEHVNNPVKGKMYLVQRPSDSKWYRARVLSNYQTAHGIKASCHLVDYAESFLVPINRLKEIPAKLKKFPSQAKPFRLHGLVPTTLHVTLEENQAELGPAEKWDIAAVEYFKNIVEDRSAQVDIHGIGQRETRFVTLYVNTPQGQVNVNEELLKQGFAMVVERDFDEVSEIGSSEGGCSRPVTPRTYTPKISSPPRIKDVKQSRVETSRPGTIPWKPGGHSDPIDRQSKHDDSLIASDADVPHGMPKTRGSCSSQGEIQEEIFSDGTLKDAEGLRTAPATGRGRGLAALAGTCEVGRTRSPSPLSPPPTTSPPSNILKSDNLQRMLVKSPQRSPLDQRSQSPRSSQSPQSSPSSIVTMSSKSPSQPSPPPRPRIRTPLVIANSTRQPFMKEVSVRPKELSPQQTTMPSQSVRKSPPSFVSPVHDSSIPRSRRNIRRGASQQSPSSSDWNKMTSTSEQSEASEGEVTTPVKASSTFPSSERAKIIQESLITQLKSGSPEDGAHTGLSVHHHGNEMGVVVHGERPPDPIRQLKNAPFPEVIKKQYEREKTHLNINLLEAYAWPAVLRGRDLVGIAPRDIATNSLAFILPIITQLLRSSTYADLPPGNGPLVLILCTSWEHAETVCELCEKYVRAASKSINTIFLYGGNNEKQQEVQLVNGCQILISTLPCVLKMKERNLTNFNRLSHVVFDEANILFRDFLDEVKTMMQEFLSVLRVDQRRSAPRQLLIFSNEWTSAIGSFLRTYMTNQLVVITHKMEAAVYARVRQNIELLDATQRTQILLGKLQSGMLKGTKSIIFTNHRKTAVELMKILTTASFYTLLATDDMPSDNIERIKKEWYTHHRADSIPILVMTDGAINDIEITDAMQIIHYDFPSNKAHYGKRMACMMRHFESQLKQKKNSSCQSLSFVSPDSIHVLAHMSDILFRSGQPLPPTVTQEQVEQVKEEHRKNKPLCVHLKSFGVCRSRMPCGDRHQIFSDVDEPGIHPRYIALPKQGTVKLIVTFVVNASHYYARLLAHRHSPDHKVVSMTADYVKLTIDLQKWYTDPVNIIGQRPLQKDDVCGFKDHAGCYLRVKVLAFVTKETVDSPGIAEVYFVDQGGRDKVQIDKLLKLPDHLCQIKFQAVEVFVSRVKPTDKDYSWNPRADYFMTDFLSNKELDGKIVLTLGNSLWLDPLVERCHLPETKNTVEVHTRREMIKQGFAVDNPNHISKLQELCKGKLQLPKDTPLTQVNKSVKLPAPARLSEDAPNQVYLSAIENPHHIYVQPVKSNYRLENLMQNLNHKMSDYQPAGECQVAKGELCIAKCGIDDRWYRGRVVDEKDDERDIFFIDHGDMEFIHKDYVCPLPQEFTDLGPQAIQCSLEAIQPPANQQAWDDKTTDEMWNMCVGETTKVAVSVEVQTSGLCDSTGGYQYTVNMYNEMGGEKILVSKRLIDAGLAQPTQQFMKMMFPMESCPSGDGITQQLNKLCAQLYQVKSLQGQLGLVAKIDELLSSESDKETLLKGGCIKSLCQVLCNGKLKENTKELLVLSLLRLSTASPRICQEIASQGGLKSIHNALMKASDTGLKEDVTSFINEISTEKRTRDLFLAAGGITILQQMLDLNNSCLVIKNVCDTFRNILFYNDVERESIPSEVISSLCNMISKADDNNKLPCLLSVLADLAKIKRNRDMLYHYDGLQAACNIMWNVRDDKVVQETALLLRTLGEDFEAVQMMIKEDMVPCLEGCLMSQYLSTQTKDECFPLIDMIDQYEINEASYTHIKASLPQSELTVPKTHPMPQSNGSNKTLPFNGGDEEEDDFDDMPSLEDDEVEIVKCHPKILWSQHANSVLLSIQVQDIKHPNVSVTTSSISFSAIVEHTEYEFEFDLFSRVDSTNYTMVSAGREFLITLYKESIGIKWTRLTQTKTKIPYISVDFERWQDDEDAENSKRIPHTSKKTSYKLLEPGEEQSIEYHSGSEKEEDEDLSDFSGDEFDKAFEDVPTLSSRSDTDIGQSS
ncbi:uncharacterized protein LOC121407226 [Lytechinus variegatus]|uniref:uncharacterized protein LOC121407226 n=1 Tax=Lytechinus variegatus TaxID=7654 RepID=UPI001BB25AD3|nr:uncharacterized protein LOC121407226 [Lytechinus variegatus]